MSLPRRCAYLLFLSSIVAAPIATVRADDPSADYSQIHQGLTKLAPLVGRWTAIAVFHNDSKITENEGTYDINWALDQTYLEYRVDLHRKDDPLKHHGFIIYVTYNPATQQYESTYFYTRWALRVTETGSFDEKTREYRTTAFIPKEDGIHDENVHTVTDLRDSNRIVYTHYSRYSNEPSEHMDVQITLSRQTSK